MIEFNSVFFLKIRQEALRKRIWFRVLNRTERAILYLVPRCIEKPRSPQLIDILAKIIVKIRNALKSPIVELMNQVGRPLAKKLSRIAQKWGHKTADRWAIDEGFAKYLTIVSMYNIPGFRIGSAGL